MLTNKNKLHAAILWNARVIRIESQSHYLVSYQVTCGAAFLLVARNVNGISGSGSNFALSIDC